MCIQTFFPTTRVHQIKLNTFAPCATNFVIHTEASRAIWNNYFTLTLELTPIDTEPLKLDISISNMNFAQKRLSLLLQIDTKYASIWFFNQLGYFLSRFNGWQCFDRLHQIFYLIFSNWYSCTYISLKSLLLIYLSNLSK